MMAAEYARAEDAVQLFHDAWNLLADLTALRRSLPGPTVALRDAPANWSQLRSYTDCVEKLRRSLDLTLRRIIKDLELRDDWQIREALLPPPGSRFQVDLKSYLAQLDESIEDPGP
jgi:hypothetical protein